MVIIGNFRYSLLLYVLYIYYLITLLPYNTILYIYTKRACEIKRVENIPIDHINRGNFGNLVIGAFFSYRGVLSKKFNDGNLREMGGNF